MIEKTRYRLLLAFTAFWLVLLVAAVWVTDALAWHVQSVAATVQCDTAKGIYVIPKPTIVQSGQYPGAEVTDWTPKTLPGNTAVATTVTVSVRWSNGETQNPKPTVKVYPDGKCSTPPPVCDTNAFGGGWTQVGVIGNVVYCVREKTNTVEIVREIPGPPAPPEPCPAGTTLTDGYCLKTTEKVVTRTVTPPPAPCVGKGVTRINRYFCLKTTVKREKVVERVEKKVTVCNCPPPELGYTFLYDHARKLWVCAPKASG